MHTTIVTPIQPVDGIPDSAEVLNCTLDFECPQQWGALQATVNEKVRHCPVCARDVHFCSTSSEMVTATLAGQCIAIVAQRQTVTRVLLGIPPQHERSES